MGQSSNLNLKNKRKAMLIIFKRIITIKLYGIRDKFKGQIMNKKTLPLPITKMVVSVI